MHPFTRRQLLKVGLTSVGTAMAMPSLSAAARLARPAGRTPPRYFLTVLMNGGVDPIYTFDPKTRREVESWVDVPYGAGDISSSGNLLLGPHVASAAPIASKLSVIRNVQTRVANHQAGWQQFSRFKRNVSRSMPTLHDIIGRYRDGQPLPRVSLGVFDDADYSAGSFWMNSVAASDFNTLQLAEGTADLLQQYEGAPPEDLARMSKILRAQSRSMLSATGLTTAHVETAETYENVAAFFERLPSLPKFQPEVWSENEFAQALAASFQRALWLFENDVTRSVYLHTDVEWDTHTHNAEGQKDCNESFWPSFTKFLQAMQTRKNAHGNLFANTAIVAGSELGRMPRLNSDGGKDHFPETPFIFTGGVFDTSGGKGAAYGHTDKFMRSRPISLKTGKNVRTGGSDILIDDVGTTLLHVAGIDPSLYGYNGNVLGFLTGGA